MILGDLLKIKESLLECKPDVRDFSWGPSLDFAEKRKTEALKVLQRAIKECKKNKN